MRPIFLVIDPPDPESLSTRKLVLESAMFNVLTANSADEGKELAEHMPVHAMIVHERAFGQVGASQVIAEFKKIRPGTPVIVLSPSSDAVTGADHVLSSHDPIELVRTLRKMFNLPSPEELEPEPLRGRR
jgi:response regulator RpfG family c-di-GMP phosphodiesterase